MKYTFLLIGSLLLQPTVQAEWWNSGMNPMGFMNKMPRSMNNMNNLPFSKMDPLSMMPDPQIPQIQFTPPNAADMRNMGYILQDLPATMPNTLYNAGNTMPNVNPWNPQQTLRGFRPPQSVYRQNVWQNQSPAADTYYTPSAPNNNRATLETQQAPSNADLDRYGQPDGRGSYHGAHWTPFQQEQIGSQQEQVWSNTPYQTAPQPQTNYQQDHPPISNNTQQQMTAPLDNSLAPKNIENMGRPMPVQQQPYQELFD